MTVTARILAAALCGVLSIGLTNAEPASARLATDGHQQESATNAKAKRKVIKGAASFRCSTSIVNARWLRVRFKYTARVPKHAKQNHVIALRSFGIKAVISARVVRRLKRSYRKSGLGLRIRSYKGILANGRISAARQGRRVSWFDAAPSPAARMTFKDGRHSVLHINSYKSGTTKLRMPRRGKRAAIRFSRKTGTFGAFNPDSEKRDLVDSFKCRSGSKADRTIGYVRIR